jgi:REP element-mobilizing transposase RayT
VSLRYCRQEKGMEIYVWCIMTNHVHLIFNSIKEEKPELILGSFKRFTSNAMVAAIKENPQERGKEWLLKQFEEAEKNLPM